MEKEEPRIIRELETICRKLERYYKDLLDIEFAADGGMVSVLQCRPGSRSARAAVRVAVDFVDEGILTEREALLRIDADKMHASIYNEPDPASYRNKNLVAKGLPACHGTVTGKLAFTRQQCVKFMSQGYNTVLCLDDMNVADIPAVKLATAVVTLKGLVSSDAAVLCRGIGKVCVTGASDLILCCLDKDNDTVALLCPDCTTLSAGEEVTVDGSR